MGGFIFGGACFLLVSFDLAGAAARGRGGLLTKTLSCTFWALLAVGLIILARNPSSGLLTELTLDLGLSWPLVKDACDALFASDDAVNVVVAFGCLVDDVDSRRETGFCRSNS